MSLWKVRMQQPVEKDGETSGALEAALFHRYAPAIFSFFRRQTSSPEDAEDLLLEVFLAVFKQKRLDSLKPEQQASLIWRIARNKLIDAYRRNTRRSTLSIEILQEDVFVDEDHVPEQELLQLEELARLHTMFQTLSPLQQQILRLRFIDELRSPQIAQLVGKSEAAVRAVLSRALNQLRTLYREGEG